MSVIYCKTILIYIKKTHVNTTIKINNTLFPVYYWLLKHVDVIR